MFEKIVLNTSKKIYVYKISSKRSVVEETVVEGVVLVAEDTAIGGINGVV